MSACALYTPPMAFSITSPKEAVASSDASTAMDSCRDSAKQRREGWSVWVPWVGAGTKAGSRMGGWEEGGVLWVRRPWCMHQGLDNREAERRRKEAEITRSQLVRSSAFTLAIQDHPRSCFRSCARPRAPPP
jgi:hypothetical protein